MDSVSAAYGVVNELDTFILKNPNSNKICFNVYKTYKRLLENRCFTNEVLNTNALKLKYFKTSLSPPPQKDEERDYFYKTFLNITNVLMQTLVRFVHSNESTDIMQLNFISNKWPSLNEYWRNSNKNTAFDDDWIRSLLKQPAPERPSFFKLVYKMFVLSWVIRHEVLGLKLPSYSTLPQFKQLYNQCSTK